MEYLDDFEKYYHSDRPDHLVQLAVIHAQFEIIHPFLDGNGRLGRILIPLFLYEKELLSRPMFYMSSWIEEHRDEYVTRLRNLGREKSAWNRWVEFFLAGIGEQADLNSETARRILELYERLKKQIIGLTRSQFAVPLLDLMFKQPIFQSGHLNFPQPRPSGPAVAGLLRTLRNAGILKVLQEGAGRRATRYVFPELINLCEGKEVF